MVARRRHKHKHRRYNKHDRLWRQLVLKRDNYTCDITGQQLSPKKLRAHHLESYAWNKLQRCNINNGVTLSIREHDLFHEWMGGIEIRCTKKDYETYKAQRIRELLVLGV